MPTTIGAILFFLSVFTVGMLWATRDDTRGAASHGHGGEHHGETH